MRLPSPLRTLIGLAVAGARRDRTGTGARTWRRRGRSPRPTPRANAVQSYQQAADGTLTPGASYLTGGAGSGAAGLGSQGALALERGWLLAVNAGSNDVSAFRVRGGHLVLVNRVPSGGTTPNSVTDPSRRRVRAQQRRHRQHHRLQAQPPRPGAAQRGSSQPLVERHGGRRAGLLHAARRSARRLGEGRQHDRHLPVDRWGRAGAGTAHASAGAAPFGFAFARHDSLAVTEAGASALSSYRSTRSRRSRPRS